MFDNMSVYIKCSLCPHIEIKYYVILQQILPSVFPNHEYLFYYILPAYYYDMTI